MLQLKKRLKISTRRKTQSPTAASSNVIESIVSLLWGNKSVGAHKFGRLATESHNDAQLAMARMSASFLVYISNFMTFLATLYCHGDITNKLTETLEPCQINWEVYFLEIKRNSRFGLHLRLLKFRSDDKPFWVLRLKIRFQQPLCGRKNNFSSAWNLCLNRI